LSLALDKEGKFKKQRSRLSAILYNTKNEFVEGGIRMTVHLEEVSHKAFHGSIVINVITPSGKMAHLISEGVIAFITILPTGQKVVKKL